MADFDTHKFIIFCLSILSIRLFIEVFNMNNHNSLIFRAVKTFLNYSIFVISYLSILILGGFAYFAAILVWPILYFFYYLLIIIFLHKRESFKIKIFVAHGLAFLFVLVYFIQGFLFSRSNSFDFEIFLSVTTFILCFISISFLYFLLILKYSKNLASRLSS